MPHFSTCTRTKNCEHADTWICQGCARIFCGGCTDSAYLTPKPGRSFSGKTCDGCLNRLDGGDRPEPKPLQEHQIIG